MLSVLGYIFSLLKLCYLLLSIFIKHASPTSLTLASYACNNFYNLVPRVLSFSSFLGTGRKELCQRGCNIWRLLRFQVDFNATVPFVDAIDKVMLADHLLH